MRWLFLYKTINELRALTGLILVFCSQPSFGQQITLVSNHAAQEQIVLPASASKQVKNAAKMMQYYILQSTGVSLPVTNKENSRLTSVHVVKTAYVANRSIDISNLDEDGFILTGVNSINYIILDGSDWGTE